MSALLHDIFHRLLTFRASPPVQQEPTDRRGEARQPAESSALLEWIDGQDSERAQVVHLIDQSDHGLGVRCSTPLDPGWPVLLTLPGDPPLKAVVRHRRRDDRGWALGLQLIRQERRRFDRRPVDREIRITWPGPDGSPRKAAGRVLDVGEGGLRFLCTETIPRCTPVTLALEGWQRSGVVVDRNGESEPFSYGVQYSGPPALQGDFELDD